MRRHRGGVESSESNPRGRVVVIRVSAALESAESVPSFFEMTV